MGNLEETMNNFRVDAFVSYLVEARCPHCHTQQNLKNSDVWWRLKRAVEKNADCIGFVIECENCSLRFYIDSIKGVGRE